VNEVRHYLILLSCIQCGDVNEVRHYLTLYSSFLYSMSRRSRV